MGGTRSWRWVRVLRRNRVFFPCLSFLLLITIAAVLAPIICPRSYDEIDLTARFVRFSRFHPLGTDENGRDVFTRLVYGARASLLVGLVAAGISVSLGTLLGALAGYFGRYVDAVIMRLTDSFMSIPMFFLLLTVLSMFGSSLRNVIIVVGLTSWMRVARLVRSEVLKQREQLFVEAARGVGTTEGRIILRHVLPQTIPVVSVATTLNVAFAILTESALSYLGLGVQPPMPSWGNMLASAQSYLWNAPQLAIYPGLLILLTVLSFNAIGDGLRDLLDPWWRRAPIPDEGRSQMVAERPPRASQDGYGLSAGATDDSINEPT
jgi:peptide/nickel transport system permease protein